MKVKALTSFAGGFSMTANEVREISDEAILADLLGAGFVIPVEEKEPETTTPELGEVAPVQQRKGRKKKDEDSGTDE